MSKITIYPELEIKKVVDYLTTEKDIDSMVVNSGVLTINVSSTLLLNERESIYLDNGHYVKIGNNNYKVSNVVKNASFDIESNLLSETKWSLAFEYRFGSKIEVNRLLVTASQQPDNQLSRFPLLWLMIDADNQRNNSFEPPVDFELNTKFAMINLTDKLYTAKQRLNNNFIPTIKPYVDLFIATLRSVYFTKIFTFENKEFTDYSEYFRYFYGSQDKNKTVFDAVTDAIEFEMPLKFSRQYNCS